MIPDDDYPHPFSELAGSDPTVEQCLWMADTYCQPESCANEFWRPHVRVLAAEVRRLRAIIESTEPEPDKESDRIVKWMGDPTEA